MTSGSWSSRREPWKDMRPRDDSNSRSRRPRVQVADRHGERVRGVERNAIARTGEKRKDHRAHLGLLRVSVPDDRFLDETRFVLEDRHVETRRGGEQNSTRMRELHRRRDVLRREDGLDGNGGGPQFVQEREQPFGKEVELAREREPVWRTPDAAARERERTPIEDDGAVAGGRDARVEAQSDQALNSPLRSRNSPRRSARRRGLPAPP